MLEFFRRYQRFFFILVTVMIVASFSFFGTFSTFGGDPVREDRVVGEAVDGSPVMLSQVQLLSRFLSTDREDAGASGPLPNLCNDGVIRRDLLRTGLADLLVASYFEPLREELNQKLERAKRYRPYMHPEAPFLSARSVWERFMPGIIREMDALQAEESAAPSTFTHLSRLYQQQSYCPPEFLRRVLIHHHRQSPWLQIDSRLQYDDLSLFGFHSLSDWFGRDFVDLSAEFILNAAKRAEQKGYRVSLEEAKGDLLHNFNASVQKLPEKPDLTFKHHLRTLGFDERSAAETWRSVLLFRRYFHGVGEATFVDRLPYRDFASYALEKAVVQLYRWPASLRLRNFQDVVELQVYLQAVAKEKDPLSLPGSFLSLDEIEKKTPELVQTTYRAKMAECSQEEIGLKASVKEVWDWQLDEKNWEDLRKKFSSLPKASSRDERFQALEKLESSNRMEIDRFTRLLLVDRNPDWIDERLNSSPLAEDKIALSKGWVSLPNIQKADELGALLDLAATGDEAAKRSLLRHSGDGKTFYRFENVEKTAGRHLLTLEEAKEHGILARLADSFLETEYPKIRGKAPSKFQAKEGEWKPFSSVREDVALLAFADLVKALGGEGKPAGYSASHRLEMASKEAWAAFQKNPEDPRWLKRSGDPLADQFKFEKKETEIQRTAQEEWMKEQAFVMVPKQWSPVHVPDDGDISFFYFEEKKPHRDPILEQMVFGKETIAADAQRYVAERLLETAKNKNAITIPLEAEKE